MPDFADPGWPQVNPRNLTRRSLATDALDAVTRFVRLMLCPAAMNTGRCARTSSWGSSTRTRGASRHRPQTIRVSWRISRSWRAAHPSAATCFLTLVCSMRFEAWPNGLVTRRWIRRGGITCATCWRDADIPCPATSHGENTWVLTWSGINDDRRYYASRAGCGDLAAALLAFAIAGLRLGGPLPPIRQPLGAMPW